MVKPLYSTSNFATRLGLPADISVPIEHAVSSMERCKSVADPAAAALAALEAPLDYPAFAAGVVPGDKLAIALDEAVPEAVSVVRGVLAAAQSAGIAAESISVVASDEEFCHLLRAELGEAALIVVHDPEDQLDLALVGLNGRNERLLVNRAIFEADIVLPIGCTRLAGTTGSSVYECLYPRLSDAETIGRLRTPSQRSTAARLAKSQHHSDEAGWLLGVPLVMQVVPGANGSVAAVVAGDPQAVAERCQTICSGLWSFAVPRQASLVIANIPGGPREQTWENVGRALAAAEPLVAETGAVAICSDLCERPGHALGQLVDNSDFAAVEFNVRNDHSADSWTAWHMARALQRGPVFFLSRLDPEEVEELGLAPISDMEELARLAMRQESCIVLDHSQYAVASVIVSTA